MKMREPDYEVQRIIRGLVDEHGTQYAVHKLLGVNKGLISASYNHATYSHKLRDALDLPLLAMVPMCAACGEVHTQLKTCDKTRAKRHYPPTLKIRTDDVESAARSMLNNLEEDYLFNLLDLLRKEFKRQ